MTQVELGEGLRMRAAATGELAHHWPEAQGLLPPGFGRDVDRYCVLELERALEAGAEPPDAPAELADAVSALRLATGAPVAAGPVLFERLDWRPFGIRPALPIAATQPPGEPTRLDSFRAEVARELLGRLSLADGDAALAEALDRWELSLFQNEPFRSEQLRGAAAGLLGETWELRAAVLLGDAERGAAGDPRLAACARERASRRRSGPRRRFAARWWRRCGTATAWRSFARSTTCCSGCGRRRGSRRRRSARRIRDAFVTKA